MQFTCWTCPVRANQMRQQQQQYPEEGLKKGSSVRRSCNELVIYYAPSWRGLINGQRIGSDLAGMSALIGRVRSSTAFAKLMQIMRASTRWWCKRCRWWASGWWWGMWGRINAGLMSQVAQKGFCGCVCLDTSRANPWPDKLYELCRRPRMNHWPQSQTQTDTPHIVNVILGPKQGDKTRHKRGRELGRGVSIALWLYRLFMLFIGSFIHAFTFVLGRGSSSKVASAAHYLFN